ncbi:UDP-N-acetylglucosamine 4,6-dehydratase [Xylanibacillus composti]|uniref:UDP-N-acetylglucosamine 4,6-dehydratase n=1 Tax=Xylanibacillus composti TaxID=1572762 RepID=A0A8J4H796_9BACL|nr:nucleoside-diphosphate sugar epimerase/dehydratase [Xylanibacillus composti]GIQ71261.1 UDP-N-acetylglucosamine 4,6-dehydratase [Xylanibacillus composti]
MTKLGRIAALIINDAMLIAGSVFAAYLLRFDFQIVDRYFNVLPYVIPIYIVLMLISFYSFKIYKRIWQYASVGDLISIFKGAILGSVFFYTIHQFIVHYFYAHIVVPRSIYLLSTILIFMSVGASRFLWRIFRDNYMKIQPHHRKALIVGAGEAGVLVVRELKHNKADLYPIAFIDDDPHKQKSELMGVPIVGTRHNIPQVVRKYGIQDIIIALPSSSRTEILDIINICKETNTQIKIIPRVNDLIHGKFTINMIRDVSVEDLLGREPVQVDMEEIAGYLRGKVVLVTGAGGSIGSEICRQVANVQPKRLILLGHGENSIYQIEMELKKDYPKLALFPIIADVQDKPRLEEVFITHKPEVVFHAAAHKHVPLMEQNPIEAIKNNILGTKIVAECADEHGTKKFVLVSTDKAVNPTSVMGATKRVAEMVIQHLNAQSQTSFAAVRFGNVLGSRGSVIPLFKRQIAQGGPVTVTHPEMIRYFMTIPEAVQLVIQAGALTKGGGNLYIRHG